MTAVLLCLSLHVDSWCAHVTCLLSRYWFHRFLLNSYINKTNIYIYIHTSNPAVADKSEGSKMELMSLPWS